MRSNTKPGLLRKTGRKGLSLALTKRPFQPPRKAANARQFLLFMRFYNPDWMRITTCIFAQVTYHSGLNFIFFLVKLCPPQNLHSNSPFSTFFQFSHPVCRSHPASRLTPLPNTCFQALLFRSIMSMLLNQEKARRQVHNDWFVVMLRLLLGLLFRKNIHCNTNMKKYIFDSFIFVEDRSIQRGDANFFQCA